MPSDNVRVELVPPTFDVADVRHRFAVSLNRAKNVRAAAAYWTAPFTFVSPILPGRLAPPGFLCIDVHLPTDLDVLAELHAAGAAVLLHLKDFRGSLGEKQTKMPPHLLHVKTFLFDLDRNEAELWTGSHNWTKRALAGPNVECSLVVKLHRDASLYLEVKDFLEQCRNACVPFNPSRLAFYKSLQMGDDDDDRVIELEGESVNKLENSVIAVFGTEPSDLRELRRIDQQVYVQLTDSSSGQDFVYTAAVVHVGKLEGANPNAGGVTLAARRYAFRRGRRLAVLERKGDPPPSVLSQGYYFVSLELLQLLKGVRVYEPVRQQVWVPVDDDVLLKRTAPELRETLAERKRPAMRVPAEPAEDTFRVESLPERRGDVNRSIVSRKIVR
jgi:hypothetical protein